MLVSIEAYRGIYTFSRKCPDLEYYSAGMHRVHLGSLLLGYHTGQLQSRRSKLFGNAFW